MLDAQLESLVERFRRTATNNRVPLPAESDISNRDEIQRLQAGLSKVIYGNAEPWMMPTWAIRHLSTRRNLLSETDALSNESHRNWVCIGGVGSHQFAVADRSGLVTANRECGSIDFWLEEKENTLFPSLCDSEGPRLALHSPEDQLYEWKTILGAVEFTRHIYHSSKNGKEAVYNEVLVKNHSLEDVEFVFYVALRPMSVLGVEPIELIESDSRGRNTYVNDLLALATDIVPSSVIMGASDDPNLLSTIKDALNRHDADIKSPKGIATAILKYVVKLTPAGSKQFFFVSPISRMTKEDELQFRFNPAVRDEFVGAWFEYSSTTTSFAFPESILDTALQQAKSVLAIQAKAKLQSGLGSVVSAEFYEWPLIIVAAARSGCFNLAKELLLPILERWLPTDGEIVLQVASPTIWSVIQYVLLSQDEDFLITINPELGGVFSILQQSIEQQILQSESLPPRDDVVPTSEYADLDASNDKGLMDSGEYPVVDEILTATVEMRSDAVPEEHIEPPFKREWALADLVAALWNLAALRAGISAFLMQGNDTQSEVFEKLASRYVQLMEEASVNVNESTASESEKGSPIAALQLLSTVALLGKEGINESLLGWALETATGQMLKRGIIKLPEPDGRFSSHLSLRLALYHVLGKREYETWTLLRRVIELLSEFHTLPDFVDPKSGSGSSGDGTSLLAAADLLLLLREMVVNERIPDLIILAAIPDEWFTATTPLIIKNLPVTTGLIDVEVGTSTNQHQIEIKMTALPNEIEIHVPTYFSLPMVKLFGGGIVSRVGEDGIAFIRAVPMSTTVVATFHR